MSMSDIGESCVYVDDRAIQLLPLGAGDAGLEAQQDQRALVQRLRGLSADIGGYRAFLSNRVSSAISASDVYMRIILRYSSSRLARGTPASKRSMIRVLSYSACGGIGIFVGGYRLSLSDIGE
jgi:hypothetical protein